MILFILVQHNLMAYLCKIPRFIHWKLEPMDEDRKSQLLTRIKKYTYHIWNFGNPCTISEAVWKHAIKINWKSCESLFFLTGNHYLLSIIQWQMTQQLDEGFGNRLLFDVGSLFFFFFHYYLTWHSGNIFNLKFKNRSQNDITAYGVLHRCLFSMFLLKKWIWFCSGLQSF